MIKKILLAILLAAVLSLGIAVPVAADSPIVNRDKCNYTCTYSEDLGGGYIGTYVFHINGSVVEYTDATRAKINVFCIYNVEEYGEEVYVEKCSFKYSYNDNVGNGLVKHVNVLCLEEEPGYYSDKFQVIYNYANGEIRVDIVRVTDG